MSLEVILRMWLEYVVEATQIVDLPPSLVIISRLITVISRKYHVNIEVHKVTRVLTEFPVLHHTYIYILIISVLLQFLHLSKHMMHFFCGQWYAVHR